MFQVVLLLICRIKLYSVCHFTYSFLIVDSINNFLFWSLQIFLMHNILKTISLKVQCHLKRHNIYWRNGCLHVGLSQLELICGTIDQTFPSHQTVVSIYAHEPCMLHFTSYMTNLSRLLQPPEPTLCLFSCLQFQKYPS